MQKIKQGHTRWKVVVYDPGKIEGYDYQYVALVFPCFVTCVKHANAIYYNCGKGQYYIGSTKYWNEKLFPTYRKALAFANQQIAYKELIRLHRKAIW